MRVIYGHMQLHCFLNGHGNHDDYDLLKNSWLKQIQLNYEMCLMRLCVQITKEKKEQKVTEFVSMQAYGLVSKHTHTHTQKERERDFHTSGLIHKESGNSVETQTIFICVLSGEILWNVMETKLQAEP